VLELHPHRLAVQPGEVVLGVPDGAHTVYKGFGDTVVEGVAGDGLQFVELPVVKVKAGSLLETLGASIMWVILGYNLQSQTQGVHLGS
jgi:hypothetical protein